MLTVKEINEVSFGKAGFSGYKPEDVDNFIDEVVDSFQELIAERDEAAKKSAELTAKLSELQGKNSDLQKKLSILAEKVESYRNEEDGIKEALLSAQKLAKDSVREAKDKAQIILEDAESSAKKLMDNAKLDAAKAAKDYMAQAENKKNELEEIKRQVSAFRVSLLEMYKKHLECINHIPAFRQKEQPAPAVEEENPPVRPAEKQEPEREIQEEPEFEEQPEVVSESSTQDDTSEEEALQRQQMSFEEALSYEAHEPTLHDRINYAQEQAASTDTNFPADDDLTDVGIDVRAYSDIPETLRKEKSSHFSNLEFGERLEFGKKKHKR